jgi:hypothetical protein
MGIDKFVRARKAVKADRATERGIAGWQAASKALDNSIDTPFKYMDSNHWPPARTRDYRPVVPGSEMIVPGMGHVTTYDVNYAGGTPEGRYRGIDLTRRGTAGIGDAKNTTSDYEHKVLTKNDAKREAKKERARSATEAELKAVDPAQY